MKFATKALIGLGILAVGALYLKAKFDAAVDAYPDDFEFDKSLDDEDNTTSYIKKPHGKKNSPKRKRGSIKSTAH